MKITRLAGLLGATVLLATTAACGGSGAGSPENAAKDALKAVVDEDFQAACELSLEDGKVPTDKQVDKCVKDAEKASKESEQQLKDAKKELEGLDEETRKMMEESLEQAENLQDEFKKMLDKGPKSVGDEKDSEVVVTYEMDGQEFPITTKKVDGNWYVSE